MEEFVARHRLSTTTFGLWAMNDSRFLFDVRHGRSCSLATVERVDAFMDAYDKKQEAKRMRSLNLA